MDELTSGEGLVALGAAGVALVALLTALFLALRVRRLRAAQLTVLGPHGDRDLVAHAERIETGFTDLREWVEESLERLDERMGALETRTDGCLTYRALVRYDAYGEMSGHQSTSVALLDARRSGVVISTILHLEQARIYVKQVHEGDSEIELSREEQQPIDDALAPARP